MVRFVNLLSIYFCGKGTWSLLNTTGVGGSRRESGLSLLKLIELLWNDDTIRYKWMMMTTWKGMAPRRGGHKDGTGLTTVDRSIKMRHNHSTELITKIYGFIFKRQTFNLSSENKRMYFALWTSSPGRDWRSHDLVKPSETVVDYILQCWGSGQIISICKYKYYHMDSIKQRMWKKMISRGAPPPPRYFKLCRPEKLLLFNVREG